MPPLLILFAKAPVPGRVKTRLTGRLTQEQAALLHCNLTTYALEMLTKFDAEVELHTDIPTQAWMRFPVARRLQPEGGLGQRMYGALADALARRETAAIVGSDAPELTPHHLAELVACRTDVTLGPAADGGFWGIACRKIHPDMFRGVTWSAEETLRQTLDAMERCGLSVSLAPVCFDVDTDSDLDRLDPALLRRLVSGTIE
jgi:hypothetical protein